MSETGVVGFTLQYNGKFAFYYIAILYLITMYNLASINWWGFEFCPKYVWFALKYIRVYVSKYILSDACAINLNECLGTETPQKEILKCVVNWIDFTNVLLSCLELGLFREKGSNH